MNKYIPYTLIIACFITSIASAQLSLSVNISYPAPTYLSDWSFNKSGMATIIYTPAANQTVMIKFGTQLKNSDGSVIASSNNASAASYMLQKGANTFSLDKVLQLGSLQFLDAAVIRSIQSTGKFPPGNYELCVSLIDGLDGKELLSSPMCRPFVQISYQLPYLILPSNEEILDANIAQSVITFRWTSIVPNPKELVTYRLQVFEVLDNQKPMQALRSNQPILNIELRNTTQYFWRPQLSMKDSTNRIFIWTVQTVDYRGEPFPAMDVGSYGRSDPSVFEVSNKR